MTVARHSLMVNAAQDWQSVFLLPDMQDRLRESVLDFTGESTVERTSHLEEDSRLVVLEQTVGRPASSGLQSASHADPSLTLGHTVRECDGYASRACSQAAGVWGLAR